MREAENFNFSLNIDGENKDGPKPGRRIPKDTGFFRQDCPNLEDIIEFIKNRNLSDDDEKSLINLAKKTPHGSLVNFRKNYMIYLNNINKRK